MQRYLDVSIDGCQGQRLGLVSEEKLAQVLKKKPPVKEWDFVRRVSSRGTWTYHFQDDLGEGQQDYFIKIFDQADVFRKAREKMFSAKGLAKPWRYPKQMLRHLFDPAFPRVGLEKALELQKHGINTAEVVAHLSRGRLVFRAGILITRQIPGLASANFAEYLISSRDRLPAEELIREKRMLMEELAAIINRLMGLNFFLPDLRVSNVMVQKTGSGELKLWLIDLVEAEDKKPGEMKMLWHLIANPAYARLFTGSDKIRFLKSYLQPSGRESEWPQLCAKLTPILNNWWRQWHKKNKNPARESRVITRSV